VQAAPARPSQGRGSAILVVNGGLAYYDVRVDASAAQWNVMGLAVANAAKHKLVGLLSQKLQTDGIYVGEVVITGSIKGTPSTNGQAMIEGSAVAEPPLGALLCPRRDLGAGRIAADAPGRRTRGDTLMG